MDDFGTKWDLFIELQIKYINGRLIRRQVRLLHDLPIGTYDTARLHLQMDSARGPNYKINIKSNGEISSYDVTYWTKTLMNRIPVNDVKRPILKTFDNKPVEVITPIKFLAKYDGQTMEEFHFTNDV